MRENRLKPCPCCGGEAKMKDLTSRMSWLKMTGYYVICTTCNLQTRAQLNEQDAEDVWNRRTNER